MSEELDPSNQRDAVCFTAGPAGAFFSAGVIHAHMAADRATPAIVAGISTGAVSAAAMQRTYKEFIAERDDKNTLASARAGRTEAGRWAWLRKYIAELTDKPANIIWDSLPNLTDFFADQNAPNLRDFSLTEKLQVEQMQANRQRFLLTGLGEWFAKLPIRVSTVATALVRFVRYKERYSGNWFLRLFLLIWSRAVLAGHLVWHIVRNPVFVNESIFDKTRAMRRPLLGWRAYAVAVAALATVAAVAALSFLRYWRAAGLLALADTLAAVVLWKFLPVLLIRPVLASIGFGRSFLNNFPIRWRLHKLFGDEKLSACPMPVLLVTAPLQTLYREAGPERSRQLWAKPDSGITCLDAITAAVARPGVWPPWMVGKKGMLEWEPLGPSDPLPAKGSLDLVDGSAVRQNPLPALLQYLWRNESTSELLQRKNADGTWPVRPIPSIHVIYSVPLSGPPGEGYVREKDANILDVAAVAQELALRRDTSLEVEQLKVITRLEIEVRSAGATSPRLTVAMADEIAPPADPAVAADFRNPLSPGRDQAFKKIAEGCRRTLETLYAATLAPMSYDQEGVRCGQLLRQIAPKRPWSLDIGTGLPEVCKHCSGRLLPSTRTVEETIPSLTSAGFDNLLVRRLNRAKKMEAQPRIVFVWSGGVFRGSFHIGMIGALTSAKIKPDLIAAASVGTLMGGALASMFSAPNDKDVRDRLSNLVDIFLNVDSKVALTRTLKEASRDLGIRGRRIRISPAMIRRYVLAGTQADAGFAAAAAPPALIDAISSLLGIPLDETRGIASKFIAGLVADAAHQAMLSVKEHTLARLNIEHALLGSSLLEHRVRELIGGSGVRLDHGQPFQDAEIAFLATTTNLGAQSQVVLWDRCLEFGKPFDFIHAALASSAFPAVFAPRRACEVFPGWGRADIRFSDGGMFDNLPFVPAVLALSRVQQEESQGFCGDLAQMKQYVADRHNNPDLFLTGALNANPEDDDRRDGPFDYFNEISARAVTLGDNSKIHSFAKSAQLANKQFRRFHCALNRVAPQFEFKDPDFVRSYVNVTVLPVFPTDKAHLNPTFAFCKSTSMDPKVLLGSIGDGCFQTFRNLAKASGTAGALPRSLRRLHEVGRVPALAFAPAPAAHTSGFLCPYFTKDAQAFECPFADAGHPNVYRLCHKDKAHRQLIFPHAKPS
jgi:predicted acylesterase/phospholipase RssA